MAEQVLRAAVEDDRAAVEPHGVIGQRGSHVHARLDGLPPMLIQVGGAELLRDEVTAFARQAERSGVRVQLEVYDDMTHGWQMTP